MGVCADLHSAGCLCAGLHGSVNKTRAVRSDPVLPAPRFCRGAPEVIDMKATVSSYGAARSDAVGVEPAGPSTDHGRCTLVGCRSEHEPRRIRRF